MVVLLSIGKFLKTAIDSTIEVEYVDVTKVTKDVYGLKFITNLGSIP